MENPSHVRNEAGVDCLSRHVGIHCVPGGEAFRLSITKRNKNHRILTSDNSMPGGGDPIGPLLASERAHHGNLTVLRDHWMQPGKAAGRAYDFIQEPMPLEIVNQPSLGRCALEQNKKVAKLFIAEMVRDKAADDDVKRPPRRQVKDIHYREIDLIGLIRRRPGQSGSSPGSGQRQGDVGFRFRLFAHRLIARSRSPYPQPMSRIVGAEPLVLPPRIRPNHLKIGRVTEERGVEPGKIAQNRPKFSRVDIVAVEPFLFMAAAPEIEALSGRLRHRARRISRHACFYSANRG